MVDCESDYREIRHLLVVASAGEADEAEWKRLETLLTDSEAARDYTVLLIDQISALEWRSTDAIPPIDLDAASASRDSLPLKGGSSGGEPVTKRLLGLFLGGSLAAAMLLGAMLAWTMPDDDAPVDEAIAQAERGDAIVEPKSPTRAGGSLVARLVELTPDAVWAPNGGPDEFLLRLPSGKRLELMSGLARIQFVSGAVVILQGPCVFTPTGSDSAALLRGRITGRADNGNFHLATPSAQVVDLGTEFGVAVDESAATDVIVFEGEVSVSPGQGQRKRVQSIFLDGGATARINADGEFATGVALKSGEFRRDLPPGADAGPGDAWLSLVDIVSGGNGLGKSLAGAIDPLTGQWDQRPWQFPHGPGETVTDRAYHRSSTHPMVDGVFVPTGEGVGVTITSAGHRVDLPASEASTWGPVWARCHGDGSLPAALGDFWGTGTLPYIVRRIEASRIGALGLHSNVGVTFDLHAVDPPLRGRISRLEAVLVNLDAAVEVGPPHVLAIPHRSADFWVFVDGKLKHSERDFGRNVEGVPVHLELKPQDRFLTLITTDAGNTKKADHIILIDPVLVLDAGADKNL